MFIFLGLHIYEKDEILGCVPKLPNHLETTPKPMPLSCLVENTSLLLPSAHSWLLNWLFTIYDMPPPKTRPLCIECGHDLGELWDFDSVLPYVIKFSCGKSSLYDEGYVGNCCVFWAYFTRKQHPCVRKSTIVLTLSPNQDSG